MTDEELIGQIVAGSQAAMEALVQRHYNTVFAYVFRRIGDYHMAYDITQEIFIKMMKSIEGYNASKGQFSNWLLKIAVNRCHDYHRSPSYKNHSNQIALDTEVQDAGCTLNEIFERKQEKKEIKRAILELPGEQRDVILFRFYHDMKIKDIARVTQSKEPTVKSRLKQGLSKLRNIILGGMENEI